MKHVQHEQNDIVLNIVQYDWSKMTIVDCNVAINQNKNTIENRES